MLSKDELEVLRAKHGGRVGVVDHEGHQLVFRTPTRVEAKDYRRKEDSAIEKPDRVDQLAQQTLIAFDGEADILKARTAFGMFLDRFPLFCDSPKAQSVLTVLSGAMEEEGARLLGKGCNVLSGTERPSPTASATG